MPEDLGEKTEDPTPHRREEARGEGNVARSTDLSAGIMAVGGVLLLGLVGPWMWAVMKELMRTMLGSGFSADVTRVGDLGQLWMVGLAAAARVAGPLTLGLAALAVVAGVIQVGFLLTLKPIQPQASRLSPLKGLQQLFSLRSTVRFGMSLGKVAVVAGVATWSIYADFPKVMSLIRLEAAPMLAAAAWLVWLLALKVAAVLLLLGLIDYAYQRWQHEEDLKMTKQQVKDEQKRMEGDPETKQRRQEVAKQLQMQRVSADVPQADVVVTNPTHFAVALRYEGQEMNAPKVIAKGADHVAARIRQVAAAHGVPMVERPPLARALYGQVEVGQEVPQEHYAAVAEILAYVYRLNGRKTA